MTLADLLLRQGYIDGQWVDADSGATFAVVNPATQETVAEVPRMGAAETRLDILLRGLGAETILITGAWTNMSIEHTARHGADAGYEVVIASDGTSTISEEWHHAALNYAVTNVGKVATCADIKAALAS